VASRRLRSACNKSVTSLPKRALPLPASVCDSLIRTRQRAEGRIARWNPVPNRGQTLLILTNLPDEASAQALATALVSERLAACVNMLAPCRSTYRWQGAIETPRKFLC
jgi:hypothetical protein